MIINVKNCNECPFCISDWNGDSIGYDTYVGCGLLQHLNIKDIIHNKSFICVYDSYDIDGNLSSLPKEMSTILDNCPLKEGKLEINLEL